MHRVHAGWQGITQAHIPSKSNPRLPTSRRMV